MRLELPKWYDLHAHFRQDDLVGPLIDDHLKMGCVGILAMPNTQPPVAKIHKNDASSATSIEHYLTILQNAGGDKFDDIIVPLYLTSEITPAQIKEGAKSDILCAAKYYPPHGTTGAQHGAPLETYIENGVFKAMEEAGIVLCIHGEEHNLPGEKYFGRTENAEEIFYKTRMRALIKKFPKLKIVCEHVTTKIAVDFVKSAPANVAATITPQHLVYTMGDLLKGLKYHLYCLPLVKFDEDRAALREAATSENNQKFFAGTDSAPHTQKMTECGCAAGCYTGGIAPQLYAEAFELAGIDLGKPKGLKAFRQFLCTNGPEFYGLPVSSEKFTLEKKPQKIVPLKIGTESIIPLPLGMCARPETETTIPWSIV